MIKPATLKDREIIIDILVNSFQDNKSVNYIIKQDKKRLFRIRKLMEYSFDVCLLFGSIFISDDKKGCALVLYTNKRKSSFEAILLDVKLVLYCCGIMNVGKALKRESKIRAFHPKQPFTHLWFIGVLPSEQNKGIGSAILKHVINDDSTVYLETSTLKNLPWYKKFGFEIYNELSLGYTLYLLKKTK
jgi:ribosomal protein S18 acetylase RimI-like enzyme